MTGRRVHEACAGVVCDMIAFQERNIESVSTLPAPLRGGAGGGGVGANV